MKKRTRYNQLVLIVIILTGLYLECTLSSGDIAGTGSQAGNGIVVGNVYDGNGQPLAGAYVYIRSARFIKDTSLVSVHVPDARTDSIGHFILDSVVPGKYTIEINNQVDKSVRVECIKDSFAQPNQGITDLGDIVAGTSGTFAGKIDREHIPGGVAIYIQVYGSDHAAKVDPQGNFTFLSIPAGKYSFRIVASDIALGVVDSEVVTVEPGDSIHAGTFILPFEYWRDTVVVREVLDSNGMQNVAVSSVTVIRNGRIAELNLTHRGINKIPVALASLRLTHLILGENFIQSLPSEFGSMISLQYIALMKNKLKGIPESISNLENLAHLDISENQIASLPVSIGQLSSLKFLSLQRNEVTSIPRSIGQLTGLIILDMGSNFLEILPQEITRLQELDFMSVNFNRLVSVPQPLAQWIDAYSNDKEWRVTQHGVPGP